MKQTKLLHSGNKRFLKGDLVHKCWILIVLEISTLTGQGPANYCRTKGLFAKNVRAWCKQCV